MSETDATLQALRVQGAAHFDPVRFRFIEALASRAVSHQGEVRRLLDGKLAAALQDYRTRLEAGHQAADQVLSLALKDHHDAAEALVQYRQEGDFRRLRQALAELDAGKGRRPLGELLVHIRHASKEAPDGVSGGRGLDAGKIGGELKSIALFRDTWLNLSVNQQLSAALAQAPDNAGPLNSHILALQSLELMRETSPDYLQHFISYVDGLLWLELAESGSKPAPKAGAVRSERDKKRKSGRGIP